MSLWTANDDPTGRPNYANTSSVYGVDTTEATVIGHKVSPGWVRVTTGTGGVVSVAVANGGSGYVTGDAVTIDGGAAPATTNASYTVTAADQANLAGTVAVLSSGANVVGTGTAFLTYFMNSDSVFVFSNSSASTTKKINKVVNNTFMNITTTWAFTNASTTHGVAGAITGVNFVEFGTGFTTATNVAITSTNGAGGVLTPTLGARAGRKNYETLVALKSIAGDAEDTVFPDA